MYKQGPQKDRITRTLVSGAAEWSFQAPIPGEAFHLEASRYVKGLGIRSWLSYSQTLFVLCGGIPMPNPQAELSPFFGPHPVQLSVLQCFPWKGVGDEPLILVCWDCLDFETEKSHILGTFLNQGKKIGQMASHASSRPPANSLLLAGLGQSLNQQDHLDAWVFKKADLLKKMYVFVKSI